MVWSADHASPEKVEVNIYPSTDLGRDGRPSDKRTATATARRMFLGRIQRPTHSNGLINGTGFLAGGCPGVIDVDWLIAK